MSANNQSEIPVIMLSVLSEPVMKIKCLEIGADDYVTRPFNMEELVARMKAVIRRNRKDDAEPKDVLFMNDELMIDFNNRQLKAWGKNKKLTGIESSLLKELVVNAGKTLSYSYLLKKIWGPQYRDEIDYVHGIVRRLRSKIELNPRNPRYIINTFGEGYLFQDNKRSGIISP